ncbi:MAG TPA: Na+/H+ antiporter NhaC, partial [Chromatiales bacterium]|nr:Na+/H+ antiporter NhaC [Chromatiales bacterium]
MTDPKPPSLLDALIPLVVLVPLLALSVTLFGADSSAGPNQLVLLAGAAAAALVAGKNGYKWQDIERAIVGGIGTAMRAILILLAVGALIGTWMMSGTVPAMIYYGLKLLNPQTFYAVTALVCAIASLSIGSSWTVAGTLGVALVGVSMGLGLSPAITAGAIVSGAYFGDKMSPLSDTTNLAAAVADVDLFDHIRHMIWTTGPSFLIALALFWFAGAGADVASDGLQLSATMSALQGSFDITVLALLPLVVVFLMAVRKFPPLPTILFGALLGGLTAVWLQPDVVLAFADAPELGRGLAMTRGVWLALADGYVSATGTPAVDELLSRGGMSSMLTTVWLIL